ncbi:MAG: hypothetical protein ACYT04_66000, partial [Nostoc sp.]
EQILAQTLLDALEPEEQKFLAQLSVFHLPVTEEIISVFMENLSPTLRQQREGGGKSHLPKLVSLASIPILHKYLANRIRRYTNQVTSLPWTATIEEVLIPELGYAKVGSRRSDFSVRELNLANLLLHRSHRRNVSIKRKLGRLCLRTPNSLLVCSHNVSLTEGILHIWDAPISLSLVEFISTDANQPAN